MTFISGFDIAEVFDPASVTAELAQEITGLVSQLTSAATALTPDDVEAIVRSPATRLVLARDAITKQLIGMLTLVVVPVPSGMICRIEDVVVDESERGRGVGEKLVHVGVLLAGEAGANWVDLTSRPARNTANRLYERLGFLRRETNLYRLDLRPVT
ncbi:MAG: GNAT family N-acetyltransferase [Mycobacteriales bacterium]